MAQNDGVTAFSWVGQVRGWSRPRFDGRSRRVFKDEKLAKYQKQIADAYRDQCPGVFFSKGEPLRVSIHVYRPLPGSKPKRITAEPDTLKPDADNIGKAVLDALNGVAFHDDAQVVELSVVKHRRIRGAVERISVIIARCEYDLYV